MTTKRRDGDAIAIAGDYQARALESPRAAQRFWHNAKLRLIDRLAPARANAHVADAGCGSGVIAAHLAKTAATVIGIDSNPAAVAYGSQAFGTSRLRFLPGPFERLLDEGPFNQIYCLEVIEHLYEEQVIETLRVFREAAAPDAQLFLTTPNARSTWPLIAWSLDRLKLVPTLDEAQHLTHFNRSTLGHVCESAGWRVDELGTFNGAAPFLAPVSERFARVVEDAEFTARRWLPLNLLFCRARRVSVK